MTPLDAVMAHGNGKGVKCRAPITLTSEGVTVRRMRRNVRPVSSQSRKPTWPVDEFQRYLTALMKARNIASAAELGRLSGIKDQQLSQWRRGVNQPSRDLLRRISEATDAPMRDLEIAAGLISPDEAGATPAKALPAQIERAIAAYFAALGDRPDLVDPLLERFADLADWYAIRAKQRRS
jgi:transcriptional regulator with XRE-family HTH domain